MTRSLRPPFGAAPSSAVSTGPRLAGAQDPPACAVHSVPRVLGATRHRSARTSLLTAFLLASAPVSPILGVDGPEAPAPSLIDEARASRAATLPHFLEQLALEPDPAARRQIVTELALAPPTAAELVLSTLLPYLARESDARCRATTLAALATLADRMEAEPIPGRQAADVWMTISSQMELDGSWDVRLAAARILAARGIAAVGAIVLEALPRRDVLWRDTQLALPALLAGVATPEAEAELCALWGSALPSDRRLALEAAAALHQAGRLDDGSWESVLHEYGSRSTPPAEVLRAGSLLAELGARDAAIWPRVSRQLSEWGRSHRDNYAGPFLTRMSGTMPTGAPVGPLAYNPALAYAYASDWWDGANHSCSSAYDSCTPWSYWGSEHCGYSSQGGDCANFVSQSLLAGGHGDLSGGLPCRGYPCGREEIGAKNLGDCLVQKGWVRTCGYQQSPPPNVAVGDVLIYHVSSCSGYTAHATFVTYVNGSDVRIAAHSAMQWDRPYSYLSGSYPYYEWLHNSSGGSYCTSYTISPTSTSPSASAGSQVVTVTGVPAGCTVGSWDANGNAAWLSATRTGPGTATVSWTANSGDARSGTATIADKTFTVNQAGGGGSYCTSYTISPTSASPSASAGSQVVTVTGVPAGCTVGSWDANGNAAWLSATRTGPGTATVSWTANSGDARSGTATIADKTFTVNQSAGTAEPLANLTPYRPSGWSDKIVVSTVAGSTTDSPSLLPTDPLYVSWFAINVGNASAPSWPAYFFDLYLDGVHLAGWYADFALNPGEYLGVPDFVVGPLSSGAHTLRLVCDSTNVVAESNEADNEYTKTIMVGAPTATRFFTATPCRLFDTRNASGADAASPILGSGETRALTIGGRCSVPSGATSLSVNLTVTGQSAGGEFLLYRGDLTTAPTASSLSFPPGKTRANNGVLELSRDGNGAFKVWNNSAGPAHFILDVNGYFQ